MRSLHPIFAQSAKNINQRAKREQSVNLLQAVVAESRDDYFE
jgi:hypothetical protein